MYFDPTDRPALKAHAKRCMKLAAPNIYLVGLLSLVLTNAPNYVTEGPTLRLMIQADSLEQAMEIYRNGGASGGFALALAILAMNIFLSLVSCGWQLYCLRASREEDTGSFETLFACFKQFWRFFVALLLLDLFVMLWSLLLFIPGIIAALSYSQTFFIMLDHPELSPREAIRASKELMRGHKAEYFILSLSFLGWVILTAFTFGLLDIWLTPYMNVTFACYYNALINWRKPEPQPEPQAAPFVDPEEWWKQ